MGVCGVGMYVYIIGVCKSILVYYVCMWLCIEGRSVGTDIPTLLKNGCHEAVDSMTLAEDANTDCYATDGSMIQDKAGWAAVNMKTGTVASLGPTTGHTSSGRGEWLGLLHEQQTR